MRFSLTGSEWVEEEKELADSSADVERVEGLLKSVQLRQSRDQLQDVVLQILQRIKSITLTLRFNYHAIILPLADFRK